MCFAPQRRALFRHRDFQKWSERDVFCTFWLGNVLCATTACTFSTSQLPKVVRSLCAWYILTSKCASRHNGVHFFDISTAKSGPELVCFVHFDFEMCFAPQRRALFRHLNRSWCVLYILTCKCASRHNGVQFFISHLARWPRTRRFSEPTFRPSGDTNHWKNAVFRDFPTFSRICIFFLLTLSLLLFFLLIFLFSMPLPCSAFHLSILSEVWLLNFLRQLQLQLHYTDYTPLQLQLHYATTTTTAAQHTTSSSCGWGDHCNHCKHSRKHTPTFFPSISGFALPSMHHNNSPLL